MKVNWYMYCPPGMQGDNSQLATDLSFDCYESHCRSYPTKHGENLSLQRFMKDADSRYVSEFSNGILAAQDVISSAGVRGIVFRISSGQVVHSCVFRV